MAHFSIATRPPSTLSYLSTFSSSPMEASPLTRQPQPEVFTPKIIQLYDSLFKDDYDDEEKTDGFWTEFFLLRPDRAALRRILNELSPSHVLSLDVRTQELFARGIAALKGSHSLAQLHSLDTLSVFLSCLLSKRYPHPSSDIMVLLAGLDQIDAVFTDFVSAVEAIIRNSKELEVRYKAVEVLLAFIQDAETSDQVLQPFILLGLLANYNKFEFQNPYQQRLNDFVNEAVIQKIVGAVGQACQTVRSRYITIQDDLPEGWTFSATLNMIGLGAIAPGPKPVKKPVYDVETAKALFTKLPEEEAAVLLATYDFTHANKLFCFNLVTQAAEPGAEQPIASYVSLTSYLLQHAYLSPRATYYAHLNLMVFRLLIEDPTICKRICSDESRVAVRLCRQRQPYLPLVKGERVLAISLLDTMIDGVNHNLRRRLDVSLYTLSFGIMLRIISYLSRTRTRLEYHWPEFFRSLLSIVRFLATYTTDLKDLPHIDTLLDHVVNLIALSLSAAEAFLPSPADYDDLFYKVVESGEVLSKVKENYRLGNRNSNSIDTLINVSAALHQMLSEGGANRQVIRQGYETLSIQAKEGLDSWERYREADERTLLKKMARAAVGDVRVMVER
uniref:Armadillo-like helical domain-containing protein n=1 Tax=Fusarium oxysporum (strain Fo5176) TaxID=660025 RepID=A0A0D2Y954_FUSOF